MSSSVNALMTQLTWEESDVICNLAFAQHEHQTLMQRMEELNLKLVQSSSSSIVIHPELEINRMHFVMQLHQQKDHIQVQINEQQEIIAQQQQHIQRIKTELKILERYLLRQEQQAQQEQRTIEEHAIEEWVLQRRKSA